MSARRVSNAVKYGGRLISREEYEWIVTMPAVGRCYLEIALRVADTDPAIPDGPLDERDLENLAECAYVAANGKPVRLLHVAAHDVPRLLREIVRLREEHRRRASG